MKQIITLIFISVYCLFSGSLSAQIQVGDIAPDFTVTDVHGHTHTLSDYTSQGKFVMLDFFFTTCGPCQYYTPQISEAFEIHGCNQGDIVILGIDYDDTDEQVLQYEQTFGGLYPSASGLEGGGNAVVSQYGISSFPYVILIDQTNTVVEHFSIPSMQVFSYYFPLYGIEEMECTTSIQNPKLNEAFLIYPNPASSSFYINASPGTIINIFDSRGIPVKKVIMDSENYASDVSEFKNGLYFAKAMINGKIYVKKFTVLK